MPAKEIILTTAARVEWLQAAAKSDGSAPRLRRFSMLAYNGVPIDVGWGVPVVIDLANLKTLRAKLPAFRDHDKRRIVGHIERIDNDGRTLAASGVVSGAGEDAREIVESSLNGFEWQASVGVSPAETRRISEGETVLVNGQRHAGPLIVVIKGVLNEISFVALGADNSTSTAIATRANGSPERNRPMAKIRRLSSVFSRAGAAVGDDHDDTTEPADIHAQAETLEADFDRMLLASHLDTDTMSDALRREVGRLRREVLAGAMTVPDASLEILDIVGRQAKLGRLQSALPEHPNEVQLRNLRASRNPPENDLRARSGADSRAIAALGVTSEQLAGMNPVIAASALRSMGHEQLAATVYGDRAVEASRSHCTTTPSLFDIARMYAADQGIDPRSIKASASGLSTLGPDFGLMFSAQIEIVMRKLFAEPVENAIALCRTIPLTDYNPARLVDTEDASAFEEVPMNGEISHRRMTFSARELQQTTFAEVFTIDERQLTGTAAVLIGQSVQTLARKGAQTVLRQVFGRLMANPGNFFSTDNKNLLTGADTALGIDSLALAIARMRSFTDKNGEPAGSAPAFLVVPPELELEGRRLLESTEVTGETGGNGSKNPMRGVAKLIVEPRLSNSNYANASTTAWYLVADPFFTPAMVLGSGGLTGAVPRPVIEMMASNPSNFNMSWRARIDFGVGMYDERGAVKATGVAS